MSDTQHIDDLVARIAPVRDEQVVFLTHTDAARALLEEITAQPGLIRRRGLRGSLSPTWRRLAVAAAIVSLVAAGLLVGAERLTSPAAAGIEIKRQGGYFVATVVDLNADPEAMRAAFRAHGLDIDLELVAVSPSLVGEIVAMSDDRSGIEHLSDEARGCPAELRCGPIGLRIPLDWDGHAEVSLGRQARVGETYVSAGNAFAQGEILHCVPGVIGASVASVRTELSLRGIGPIWHVDERIGGASYGRILESPDGILDWVIVEAVPASPRSVHLFAEPSAPHDPGWTAFRDTVNAGC